MIEFPDEFNDWNVVSQRAFIEIEIGKFNPQILLARIQADKEIAKYKADNEIAKYKADRETEIELAKIKSEELRDKLKLESEGGWM